MPTRMTRQNEIFRAGVRTGLIWRLLISSIPEYFIVPILNGEPHLPFLAEARVLILLTTHAPLFTLPCYEATSLATLWRGAGLRSFRSQTLHRVHYGCPDGLETDSAHCDKYCQQACQCKNPPADINPVSKIFQPAVHAKPGNRRGNNK